MTVMAPSSTQLQGLCHLAVVLQKLLQARKLEKEAYCPPPFSLPLPWPQTPGSVPDELLEQEPIS